MEYFSTKRDLNLRQAGWYEFLAQYHFRITYRPGTANDAADALTRKSEDVRTQKDKRKAQREMVLFRLCGERDTYQQGETETAICMLTEPASMSGFELVDKLLEANQHCPALE